MYSACPALCLGTMITKVFDTEFEAQYATKLAILQTFSGDVDWYRMLVSTAKCLCSPQNSPPSMPRFILASRARERRWRTPSGHC